MEAKFGAVIKRDGDGLVAYCPQVPGANGQGRTRAECIANLRDAISLMLEERGSPPQDSIRITHRWKKP